MKPTVGLHVMGQDPNGVYNWEGLFQWTALAKPSAMIILNNLTRAGELYRIMPTDAKLIHRKQEANDSRLHLIYTPEQYVATLPTATPFYHQVGNEPDGYNDVQDYVNWLLKVIDLADEKRIRLALPAFGMGNPDDMLFNAAIFDMFIEKVGRKHLLIQHEYFVYAVATEPFHIGRVRYWGERARALRLPEPDLVVTEAGTDIGGGFGDGWRGKGWSSEFYANMLMEQAKVYEPLGIPMCVYCYGVGFEWRSFDIQDDIFILSQLLEYNLKVNSGGAGTMTPLPDGTPIKKGTVTKLPDGVPAVNVRQSPSTTSQLVTTLKLGDATEFAEPNSVPNWYWVRTQEGKEGWVSKQDGRVVIAEVKPLPEITPVFTKIELQALAAAHTAIASLYSRAAERMPA